MPFEVQHIPLLAKECRRIYYVTETLRETIHEAEKQTLKRILRKREDANTVLAEMKQLLSATTASSNGALPIALTTGTKTTLNIS
ncbi:MAG: hypothetical protein ACR5LC_13205 [Symbiopectobacterium sp.]|uniref:hypothetical protein n=1 Tax=Symbiopectobacterium sp. TaxID=2952789 RepID=UPI003F3BC520